MLKEIPQTMDISEVEEDPFIGLRVRGLTPEDLKLLPSEDLQWVDVDIVTDKGKSFTLKHLLEHYIGDDVQSRIYIFRPSDDSIRYRFEDVRRVREKVIAIAGGSSPDDDGRIMLGKDRLTPSGIAELTERYKKHFRDVQIREAIYFDTQITPESLGLSSEKVSIEKY